MKLNLNTEYVIPLEYLFMKLYSNIQLETVFKFKQKT